MRAKADKEHRDERVAMIKAVLAQRRCVVCGGSISWKPQYVLKYPNHLPVTCCKRCHGIYSKRAVVITKDEAERRICDFIKAVGHHVSYAEAHRGCHISTKVLRKLGISVSMLNKRVLGDSEARVYSETKVTRSAKTLSELCDMSGIKADSHSSFVHALLSERRSDVAYLLDEVVCSYIASKGRYLGVTAIMHDLCISHDCLRGHYAIDVIGINKSLGFLNKRQSWYEEEGYAILCSILDKFDISREHSFDGCRSSKNWLLRFDFYIAKYNLLVEVDGEQHTNNNNGFFSEATIVNDNIKANFAERNNIKLVRVPAYPRRTFSVRFRDAVLDVLKPIELLETQSGKAEGNQQPSSEQMKFAF